MSAAIDRACPALRRALGLAARNHVVHFLVLGGAIFGLAPRPESDRDVHLSRGQLAALYGAEARRSGHGLDPGRRSEIDARAVEDEVLYREALRLGLDRGDGIVRQRLIQKVIFLAEDLGGATSQPSEAELRAHYEATRERWQAPARLRFVHVFAAPGRQDTLTALRPRLLGEDTGNAPPELGDAFPLSRSVAAAQAEIAAEYGQAFADRLSAAPLGAWSEPLASRFGTHLVKLIGRDEPRQETFEEARPRLKLAYLVERKESATRHYLAGAFQRYRVDIDGQPVASYQPSARTSPERQPAED